MGHIPLKLGLHYLVMLPLYDLLGVSTARALDQYATAIARDARAVVLGEGIVVAGDAGQLEEQLISFVMLDAVGLRLALWMGDRGFRPRL
jgi:hypothetical protein